MSQKNNTSAVLLIGGSDSGGGAGLQADLRAVHAHGIAGACVVTAATAQNTREVRALNLLPAVQVAAQLDAVLDDIQIAAIKLGMLGTAKTARLVFERICGLPQPIVLDPVLLATSGGRLLDPAGLRFVRRHLLPVCRVITPNIPEAEALLGRPLDTLKARRSAAQELVALGAGAVLLKGGHGRGSRMIDIFADATGAMELAARRLPIRTHGTGCTYASAIAAGLALGQSLDRAVRGAHDYLQSALQQPLRLGRDGVCSPGIGEVVTSADWAKMSRQSATVPSKR
jgi:hydroxymethylpyrimidine/phosphomethylpyrimidine kinase